MTDIRVAAERGCSPGLTVCWRPIFTCLLPITFDMYFNGPWGYRAQYFLGAENGLKANAALLAELTPSLLAAVDLTTEPDLAKIDLCASLGAASAKIWIHEDEFPFGNLTRDLAVDRWIEEAHNGVELAQWGLCAPKAKTVQVKGALIDPYGNEVVPAKKIRRHYDIYHYGFS